MLLRLLKIIKYILRLSSKFTGFQDKKELFFYTLSLVQNLHCAKKISETKYGVKKIYIFFQKQFPKYNKKKTAPQRHTSQTLTLFFIISHLPSISKLCFSSLPDLLHPKSSGVLLFLPTPESGSTPQRSGG